MLDVRVSFLRHSLRHFPEGNLASLTSAAGEYGSDDKNKNKISRLLFNINRQVQYTNVVLVRFSEDEGIPLIVRDQIRLVEDRVSVDEELVLY